jgi:hypothetical protein
MSRISTRTSPALINSSAFNSVAVKTCRRCSFDELPHVT